MNLEIISIHNHGDQTKEYVDLKATEDCDIGHYLLADTTYTKTNLVSNKLRHIYWLPDKPIQKGEFVRIFTRTGTGEKITTPNGSIVHTIFWGLKTPIWNDAGDSAVLMHIDSWSHFKVK